MRAFLLNTSSFWLLQPSTSFKSIQLVLQVFVSVPKPQAMSKQSIGATGLIVAMLMTMITSNAYAQFPDQTRQEVDRGSKFSREGYGKQMMTMHKQ